MNFDSILSIVLLVVFFALPSVFKQMAGKKKAGTPRPGIFSWISTRIKNFADQIESRAGQPAPTADSAQSLWDALAEDETITDPEPSATFSVPENDLSSRISENTATDDPDTQQGTARPWQDNIIVTENIKDAAQDTDIPPPARLRFRKNQLQNAIIWSEILSKPLAFRD